MKYKIKKISEMETRESRIWAVCTSIYKNENKTEMPEDFVGYERIFYAPTDKYGSGHVKNNLILLNNVEDYTPSVDCENVTVILYDVTEKENKDAGEN